MSAAYLNVRLVTPFRPCWPTLFLPSGHLIILIIQQQYSNLQRMQSLKIIYTFNLSVTPDTEPSFYFPYRTIRISLASENPSSWKDMHRCSSLNQPPRTFLLQSFDASQYPCQDHAFLDAVVIEFPLRLILVSSLDHMHIPDRKKFVSMPVPNFNQYCE